MSGHSKWSQIKRQKGAADVKRSAVFGRLANAIIIAAKSGGDPNANFSLKMAIEKAKSENMPKENIDRAIKRGTGEIGGGSIDEALYEIIAPGNIGIIIEAATDNKNRTTSEIKNTAGKFGGKLASSGAVTYQFSKMGKLIIDSGNSDKDEIELLAIDAGVQDFADEGDILAIYTLPNELELVKKNLEENNIDIQEATLTWEPKQSIDITEKDQAQKILNLMENLENLEDVTAIHANFSIEEELLDENTGH